MKKLYGNPLDLNYEYRLYYDDDRPRPICLEAADPVMVVFEGKYYLFSSITKGYWVSGDSRRRQGNYPAKTSAESRIGSAAAARSAKRCSPCTAKRLR